MEMKRRAFTPATDSTQAKEKMAMPTWQCQHCGFREEKDAPPETCPSCKQKCEFVDVSCYTPDCQDSKADNRLK